MKLFLIGLDGDHSPYIRDLINKDRIETGDPKLIDQEIQKYTQKIEDLKEKKKLSSFDALKVEEIIKKHAPAYKENASSRSEFQRFQFIERSIMPELKKCGYKGKPDQIDELLLQEKGD